MSKQSLAIAYAVKRKARMAKGGSVEAPELIDTDNEEPNELLGSDVDESTAVDGDGFLEAEPAPEPEDSKQSVLERIMSKNRRIR